jgi:hypothetical protein
MKRCYNSTFARWASFPVFNPVLDLSRREHPTGGSILLHTVVLDLTNGHTKNERSWGDVGKTDLIAAGNRFVVISDRRIQVISRDLQPEREYRYGFNKPSQLRTSETGGTLFVLVQGEQNEVVEVLDPSGQQAPYTFRVASDGNDAFSDSNFAFIRRKGKTIEIFRASLEQLRRGAANLQPLRFRTKSACRNPFFITNELLILGGKCDKLTVLGPDGAIKAEQPVGEPGRAGLFRRLTFYLAGFVTSRDQTRFAFILRDAQRRARKGELPAAVYPTRTLLVYDASLTKLFETPVRQVAKATYAVDQALSPDGSLVALLVGWTVTVYRVPEPPQ